MSALTALSGAWLLDGLDGDGFFRLLLILQLATLTADLPAMSAVYRVRIPERPRREPVRFGAWLRPFRNARFRPLLGFGFLHALWTGLLSTYLVVFLLKIKNFPPFWIILLELGLSLAAAAGASRAGRLADRYGYAATMAAGSAVIALASFGWALMPASALFLTLFLFLVYNGNNGISLFDAAQSRGECFVRARGIRRRESLCGRVHAGTVARRFFRLPAGRGPVCRHAGGGGGQIPELFRGHRPF